jgi:hypothetical protein
MSQIFLGPPRSQTREYIDWQWQLSGEHSIIMVFSAAWRGWEGARPTPRLEYHRPLQSTPSPAKLAREGYLGGNFIAIFGG